MKYDVFISYSSKDAPTARRICYICEHSGLKCFFAERDIPKGKFWAQFIVDAICESSTMVALFSENYNISEEVDREISLASLKHIPILVYRIDMSEFQGAKAYYFSNLNWYSSLDEGSSENSFIESIQSLLSEKRSTKQSQNVVDSEDSQLIAPSIVAAQNGDTEAQFYLGRYYDEKGDSQQAVSWYRKAAKSGVAAASYNISSSIFQKGVQEEYPREGFINAEKAYAGGIQIAGMLLAWCYVNGREVAKDYKKGLHYITEFLETKIDEPRSLGMAYNLLGNYYRFGWGNTPISIPLAMSYWEKSAAYGNQDAIYNLGASYLNGDGVTKDESRAFAYFQKGVEFNDIKSYMGLALCYRRGLAGHQDIHKAIELYKHAAESGDSEAFACLGAMYLGDGLPVNEAEAARWFYEGAKRGNTTSQHYLGIMYFNGMGVPRNQSEGIKLLKMSAEKGNMDSIISLKKLGLL